MRHHRWIVGAGSLLGLVALTAAAPTRSESFALILVREGSAWRASCESGCAWQTVESRRSPLLGTSVVIDNRGISGSSTLEDTGVTFAFRVTADGRDGWKATGLTGTAWTALSFRCAGSPCRARVTEAGVERVR